MTAGCVTQRRDGDWRNWSTVAGHCERSEAIQYGRQSSGLLRRHAPRNDEGVSESAGNIPDPSRLRVNNSAPIEAPRIDE